MSNLKTALRTFNHLMEPVYAAHNDDSYDCGEFSGQSMHNALEDKEDEILNMVADRFQVEWDELLHLREEWLHCSPHYVGFF